MGKSPYTFGSAKQWSVDNLGILHGVFRTRKEAKEYAEQTTGEPWAKCCKYMIVRRCTVTEGWKP